LSAPSLQPSEAPVQPSVKVSSFTVPRVNITRCSAASTTGARGSSQPLAPVIARARSPRSFGSAPWFTAKT
jgi:hypothetical protein